MRQNGCPHSYGAPEIFGLVLYRDGRDKYNVSIHKIKPVSRQNPKPVKFKRRHKKAKFNARANLSASYAKAEWQKFGKWVNLYQDARESILTKIRYSRFYRSI